MAITDEARIVEWVLSKLREDAPYDDIEELMKKVEELAEEIEERSKGGITKEQVISWLEDYTGELLDLLTPVTTEEEREELYYRLKERIIEEVVGLIRKELRKYRWYGEEEGEEGEETEEGD